MSKPVLVNIDDLKPSAYNPRKADRERLDLVKLSLQKFGWLLPIYADSEGEILSGHQRHLMAAELGATKVPVVFVRQLPIERRMGVNVLYNRATNDLKKNTSSQELLKMMRERGDLIERVKALPDLEIDAQEWYPIMKIKPESVLRLMKSNAKWEEQHAVVMASQLKSSGLPTIPVIVDDKLNVLNGRARLTYLAQCGTDFIDTVRVSSDMAEEISAMMNLISMDFNLEERYADLLRYNSFRRKNQRVQILTPTFLEDMLRHHVPSGNRNAAFHLDDPEHISLWKRYYGEHVIDFGAGLCDKTDTLNDVVGVDCVPFEPFFLSEDVETIDTEGARRVCKNFLDRVADGTDFSSIFISSVLNSVPFYEDRLKIIAIISALCSDTTGVYASAISTESDRWHNHAHGNVKKGHDTSSGGFPLDYEPRIIVADISMKPKVQKYHTEIEWKELWLHGFKYVDTFETAKNGLIMAVCKKPREINVDKLREALEFEFDLPHPNGKRLGLAEEAKAAFGKRLGIEL
jgi:hypothetical protein